MAGIVEAPAAARESVALVEAQMARFDTTLATAHDPEAGGPGAGAQGMDGHRDLRRNGHRHPDADGQDGGRSDR